MDELEYLEALAAEEAIEDGLLDGEFEELGGGSFDMRSILSP